MFVAFCAADRWVAWKALRSMPTRIMLCCSDVCHEVSSNMV